MGSPPAWYNYDVQPYEYHTCCPLRRWVVSVPLNHSKSERSQVLLSLGTIKSACGCEGSNRPLVHQDKQRNTLLHVLHLCLANPYHAYLRAAIKLILHS